LSLSKNAEKRMYPARRTGSSAICPEAIWTTTWWARVAPANTPDTNVRERSADSASQGSALERSQEKNSRGIVDGRGEAVLRGEVVLN
jgi:hypothetical protein